MSEFIQEFEGKTLSEWEDWYLKKKPDAIKIWRNFIESHTSPNTA